MQELTTTTETNLSPAARTRQAVASLPQHVRSSLTSAERFDATYDFTGYRQLDLSREEAHEALKAVDPLMRPADPGRLAKALAGMFAVTKARAEGVDDTEFALRAFVECLRRYPGDLALKALAEWPHRPGGKWRPSVSEIVELMGQYGYTERKALHDALCRAAAGGAVIRDMLNRVDMTARGVVA